MMPAMGMKKILKEWADYQEEVLKLMLCRPDLSEETIHSEIRKASETTCLSRMSIAIGMVDSSMRGEKLPFET